MVAIRPAKAEDLDSITKIYNEAVATTVATFDTEPKTVEEQRAWFEGHGAKHPIMVAELDGAVVGWASLSQWSDRRAYCDTAEISLYVKEGFQARGIGRRLLEAVTQRGQDVGLHTVIARIVEGNETSVRLHQAVGFQHIGVMKEVGSKFGRLLDVYLMQKMYGVE